MATVYILYTCNYKHIKQVLAELGLQGWNNNNNKNDRIDRITPPFFRKYPPWVMMIDDEGDINVVALEVVDEVDELVQDDEDAML